MYRRSTPPGAIGLYDPANEHDGCGIALVAKLWGEASHAVVEKALDALENLEHRGAEGADPNTGDGAGILLQIPDAFLRDVAGFDLPPRGAYAVGTAFLEGDADQVTKTRLQIEELADEEGLQVLGWRDVPVDPSKTGEVAGACRPVMVMPTVLKNNTALPLLSIALLVTEMLVCLPAVRASNAIADSSPVVPELPRLP